jgi:hypothetical protein
MMGEPSGRPSDDLSSALDALEAQNSAPPAGEAKACPSAYCEEGALLLGVMTPSGKLAYVQPPTRIDAVFVARAQALGRPEARFRFSAPCREAQCPQWTGEGCAVVDMALDTTDVADSPPASLPACAIRRTCRWYSQRGGAACAGCPLIVADIGGVGTYRSTVASQSGDELAPRAHPSRSKRG